MPNEKMENLLNLALAATQEEREKSLELDIGYDSAEQTWEVIVKFVGTTEELETLLFKNFPEEYPRIQLTNLQNEYAVLVLPEHLVEPVAALDKIEYMEKPKLLFFAVDNGKRASCITQLQERTGLSGAGVLVAVIDSGIDYAHPDFRRADGTTRIVSFWDQTIPASGACRRRRGISLEPSTMRRASTRRSRSPRNSSGMRSARAGMHRDTGHTWRKLPPATEERRREDTAVWRMRAIF